MNVKALHLLELRRRPKLKAVWCDEADQNLIAIADIEMFADIERTAELMNAELARSAAAAVAIEMGPLRDVVNS